MWQLITNLDETVIAEGTKAEMELVLKAFETYGIRRDIFLLVPTDSIVLAEEALMKLMQEARNLEDKAEIQGYIDNLKEIHRR